jgi:hypothetical protein
MQEIEPTCYSKAACDSH